MRAVPDRAAFCRVTLFTPRGPVDVALPVDVPLAELVPLVLELLGEPRRSQQAVGWRFSRATGVPLPPGATLEALDVLDGDLLRLGPHAPPPAAPVFDDPVDAVAASAGSGDGAAGPLLRACVAVAASLLAAGLVVAGVWSGTGSAVLAVLTAGTGAVACLAQASAAARRAGSGAAAHPGAGGEPGHAWSAGTCRAPTRGPGRAAEGQLDAATVRVPGPGRAAGLGPGPEHAAHGGPGRAGRPPGTAVGGAAGSSRRIAPPVGLGASRPAVAPSGAMPGRAHPADPGPGRNGSPPVEDDARAGLAALTAALCAVPLAAAAGWAAVPGPAGAGQLLVAAAVAGCVAAAGQIAVRVVAPVLVGTVVVAGTLLALAALRLWLGATPAALAAGAGTLALAVGPVLPRLALTLSGLPRPSVPADAGELVTDDRLDRLPPAELADRADLARGFLAGLVAGAATVAAASAVLVAQAGGWAAPASAIVMLLVTGLRTRGFADAAPARATLVAALAGVVGVAVVLSLSADPVFRLVGAALAGAAALGSAAVTGRTEAIASPVSRRAVDLLEGALLAASIPLALAVIGVYALVRGL